MKNSQSGGSVLILVIVTSSSRQHHSKCATKKGKDVKVEIWAIVLIAEEITSRSFWLERYSIERGPWSLRMRSCR